MHLEKACNTLGGILGDLWKGQDAEGKTEYSNLSEKIYSQYLNNTYFTEILVAQNIDDELAIKIKAAENELPGVYIDSGSKESILRAWLSLIFWVTRVQ